MPVNTYQKYPSRLKYPQETLVYTLMWPSFSVLKTLPTMCYRGLFRGHCVIFHKIQSIEVVLTVTFLFQREVFDRGEQRAIETAREDEPDTGQEADVDPKVLRKLKDTIVQRDNEISILARLIACTFTEADSKSDPDSDRIHVVGKTVWNLNPTLYSVKISA